MAFRFSWSFVTATTPKFEYVSAAVADAYVAGGSVNERRFVMVSTPVGSRVSWPGEWFADYQAPAATHSWSAWRLLGANNRELARSHGTYPDAASCAAAIRELQSTADRLVAAFRPGFQTGRWYWQASVDGVPLAISARPFGWRRDCEHNFDQFVAALSGGAIEVGRLTVNYSDDPVATTG
jgi:hypothetical protein